VNAWAGFARVDKPSLHRLDSDIRNRARGIRRMDKDQSANRDNSSHLLSPWLIVNDLVEKTLNPNVRSRRRATAMVKNGTPLHARPGGLPC